MIRTLQETDFKIVALTRDTASPSAQKLSNSSRNVKLLQGDLSNAPAIFEGAKRVAKNTVWGVYGMHPAGAGKSVEKKQGNALIDAAITADVRFFVYSSIDRGGERSSSNPTSIRNWASKYHIEKHLEQVAAGTGMRFCVLRPTGFMEELTPDFGGKAMAKMWDVALKDKSLQLVATKDIGWFAAQAFKHPDEFAGRYISLAGDELTFRQANEIFKAKFGKDMPGTFGLVARGLLHAMKDIGAIFKWFKDEGNAVDIEELGRMNPELMDFGAWLERERAFRSK